ncbi:MAG: hypothetical protein PHQ40_09520 [Anaerolineaceae bacterium]|nr:hypothetical protein [Anaerolineaceae bacterium]
MNWTNIVGLVVVLLFAIVLTGIWVATRRQPYSSLRPIAAFGQLRKAINLAVEDGSRVHVSLGSASILNPQNASALVGLTMLERAAQLSSASDRPPVVTSGESTLAILSQDRLHSTYRQAHTTQEYDPHQGRLTGLTPFSYAVGSMPVFSDEQVSANIMVGNFGPEAALMADAAAQTKGFLLAGSDNLSAQAVLYAAAQEPLIGEEVFAGGAYLQAGAAHAASLRTEDITRWVLVAVLLAGSALKLAGVL